MTYMMLIIEEPGGRLRPPIDERRQRYRNMVAFAEDLQSKGKLKVAQALALPEKEGARIRKRGQNHATVDGPFAEAKEIVGGFFYLDCDSREEALAIAARCPATEWATVEVRRVATCFEEQD